MINSTLNTESLYSSPSHITGTITFADGSTRDITERDIPVGGLSIEYRAVTGDTFEVGAAVIGELDLKLITPKSEGRAKYFDAVLTLYYKIDASGSSIINSVNLGQWIFVEVERNRNLLEIVAYDNLIKLDKELDKDLSGTVWNIISTIKTDCGVNLASTVTSSNVSKYPNGGEKLNIPKDGPFTTYRQVASAIAQMCGRFVMADRYGGIDFRDFDNLALTQEAYQVRAGRIYNYKLSDYDYKINNVEVNCASGTYIKSPDTAVSGTTLYVNDAYAWDLINASDLETKRNGLTSSLMNYFNNFNAYRPCELTLISDPRIECGDRLTLYHDEGKSDIVVTSYVWTYHDKMEVVSAGKNPYLKSNRTSHNYNSYLLQTTEDDSIDASEVILHHFSNESEVVSNEDFPQIASVTFLANRDTYVTFNGTLQVDVEVDDIIEEAHLTIPQQIVSPDDGSIIEESIVYTVPYKRDGHVDIQFLYKFNSDWIGPIYKHTLTRGSHIITLHYPLVSIKQYSVNSFGVYIGSSTGNVSIDKGMFIGTISGQGIAQALKWDGAIVLEDFTESLVIPENNITLVDFDEQIDYSDIIRNDSGFSDLVDNEIIQAMTMVDIDDTLQLSTEEGE